MSQIKTTVVGSYPIPSWLVGNTSRQVLRDAVMVDQRRPASRQERKTS